MRYVAMASPPFPSDAHWEPRQRKLRDNFRTEKVVRSIEENNSGNGSLIPWSVAEIPIPGLRQIKHPGYPKLGKAFWFLAIVVSAGLCIEQVQLRCKRFIHSPIDLKVGLQQETSFPYPSFTICTSNATLFNNQTHQLLKLNGRPEYNENGDFWKLMNDPQNLDVSSLWEHLRIDIDRVILNDSCGTKTCFCKKTSTTFKGNCITVFTTSNIKHVGARTGVNIRIKPVDKNLIYNTEKEQALSIYCHEKDWSPQLMSYYSSSVYHGYITTIIITRRSFTYITQKENPCTTTIEASDCWRACIEESVKANATAKCKIPGMTSNVTKFCEKSEEVEEIYNVVIARLKDRKNNQCKCPKRCTEIVYNMLQDVVMPTDNGDTVLNIYMPDNAIESLTEVLGYTFVNLLIDLGGTLGLFLGFCALTLVELVEVLFDLIRYTFSTRQKPQRRNPPKHQQHGYPRGNLKVVSHEEYEEPPRPGRAIHEEHFGK